MKHAKTYGIFYCKKSKTFILLFFPSFITFSKTRLLLRAFLENGLQDLCKSLAAFYFSYLWSQYLYGSCLFVYQTVTDNFPEKTEASDLESSLQCIGQLHLLSKVPEWLGEFLPVTQAAKQPHSLVLWLLLYESSRKSVKFTSFDADQASTQFSTLHEA